MPPRPLLALTMPLWFGLMIMPALADEPPAPTAPLSERLADMQLLRGPWDAGTILRESVLFIKGDDGKPAAKLLFDVDRFIKVRAANGSNAYEEGRDYVPVPDGSGLTLPDGSRIASINESQMFAPKGAAMSIGHRAGHPETNLLFDNAHYFHDLQVEVSYVSRAAKWDAYRPAFAGDRLTRTVNKLRNKQPITIAVSGDSISEGYNASLFTKTAPFQPSYSALVAAQLEATYGAKVTHRNFAVGGWSSKQGLDDIEKLLKSKPDLIFIAYGMNDVGRRDPKTFRANIEGMLKRIRENDASTEVILIATMTGNPDWVATPPAMFTEYRDTLASLTGPGVALADLTAIWQRLMVRKRHLDVTGNGVNHPDDYGHRVYAQAILALLVEPGRVVWPTSTEK